MRIIRHPQQINAWLEQNLLKVQKPGRYTGGELNQVIKSWDDTSVHVALAFPDIYDIGFSNLGLSILYDLVNQDEQCLAERIYTPWLDMEQMMRKERIPIFSLESKHAMADFDIVGISIPYESLYTNVLNLLDLGNIPLRSGHRSDQHPLILAGGNSTSNPEPMADFIDCFAIGEGEEIIKEVILCWLSWRNSERSRKALLQDLSKLNGIYVPCFYQPIYNLNGTLSAFSAISDDYPKTIKKRIVSKLPPPPVNPIVPSIEVVHDRYSVELMRGCSRGCRFCHAGMTLRPVRERPIDEVLSSIDTAIKNTGYEGVGLLSLSSSDYTHIEDLVKQLQSKYSAEHLNISLPSLRIDSLSIDLIETISGGRHGGFTLAPEAATEKIRNTINKPIDTAQLLAVSKEIFSRGWLTLKLYFMIGLPNETEEDVHAIADLCHRVLKIGKSYHRNRASLHVSIGTFIPKAHTPFQWEKVDFQSIKNKQAILLDEIHGKGFRLDWSDSRTSRLEAWFSRGNRKLSELIFSAWKKGAKFDAWQDQIDMSAWEDALRDCRMDENKLENPFKDTEDVLPWDHINFGLEKKFLISELLKSRSNLTTTDCSLKCANCGILTSFSVKNNQSSEVKWKCSAPITRTSDG